jgi:hypothetical protein
MVTTGCTGISRLRRRVAPAALEMTNEYVLRFKQQELMEPMFEKMS